jgi:hypothetical protein
MKCPRTPLFVRTVVDSFGSVEAMLWIRARRVGRPAGGEHGVLAKGALSGCHHWKVPARGEQVGPDLEDLHHFTTEAA